MTTPAPLTRSLPAGPAPIEPAPPPWRAPLIGALLIPPAALMGVYSYTIVQAMHWSQQSLKCGPIFLLFVLTLGNLALRRLSRRLALNRAELVLIYAMLVTSTAVGGIGMVQFFVTGLPAPYYYATGNNHWREFFPYIPAILTPHDHDVISRFFRGNASLYDPAVLRDWAIPVAAWTALILLVFVTTLSLNTLLCRRWIEGERLTFPLVFLPLEMTRGGGEVGFWQDRRMWAGFLLAGLLESVDYVNYLYPAFPYVQVKAMRLEPLLTERPWSGVGTFAVAFYPFMIGIAFLLTLDVSFSCWFFYLLVKAQMVLATALGSADADAGPMAARPPYTGEQGAGAFLGVALLALWSARGDLRASLGSAFGVRSSVFGLRNAPGPNTERVAWLGLLGGFAATVLFWNVLGMSLWLSALFLGLYLLFLVTLTRIVAEAGAGWHFAPNFNPHALIFSLFGQTGFGARDLTMLAYTDWIDMDYRDHPMPHQLEAMKMGSAGAIGTRRLVTALLLAAVLGQPAHLLRVWRRHGQVPTLDHERRPGAVPLAAGLAGQPSPAGFDLRDRDRDRPGDSGGARPGPPAALRLAAPPAGLCDRQHQLDGLHVDAVPDRLGDQGAAAPLRRDAALPGGAAVLPRPDPGRLRGAGPLGDLRRRHRAANVHGVPALGGGISPLVRLLGGGTWHRLWIGLRLPFQGRAPGVRSFGSSYPNRMPSQRACADHGRRWPGLSASDQAWGRLAAR